MKTLFNKITKNVILPLVVAGGIYNKCISQTITDSLIKFNQENKQVYEDFAEFMRLQKTRKRFTVYKMSEQGVEKSSSNIYGFYYDTKEVEIDYSPQAYGDSVLEIRFFDDPEGYHFFADDGLNGLQERGFDICTYDNKNGFYKSGFFSGVGLAFGKEKQLSIAKEYRNLLIQIMHDAGVSKY